MIDSWNNSYENLMRVVNSYPEDPSSIFNKKIPHKLPENPLTFYYSILKSFIINPHISSTTFLGLL